MGCMKQGLGTMDAARERGVALVGGTMLEQVFLKGTIPASRACDGREQEESLEVDYQ